MTPHSPSQSLHFEFDLPHPPDKVWRALTDPELVSKWIMSTDLLPEMGHNFTFRMEPSEWWDGIVHCEILAVDPPHEIAYTWKGGPANSPLDTVVTWKLSDNGSGGTLLALDHTGFVPTNKFAFEGAQQGWKHRVDTLLRNLLETV